MKGGRSKLISSLPKLLRCHRFVMINLVLIAKVFNYFAERCHRDKIMTRLLFSKEI